MSKVVKTFTVLLLSTTMLTGCQTTGGTNKSNIGTLLGGAIGAIAGSQFGSGSGRIAATILGGAIGAFAGRAIGQMLDEQDQVAMQNKSAYALANARDGEQINWRSDRTGAQAVLTPTATRKENRSMTLVRDQRVSIAPNLELIGEPYAVKSNANVRSGPSTDYTIVNNVRGGSTVGVVGKVRGQDWYLVSRDRVSIGYVYGSLLTRSTNVAYQLGDPIDLDQIQLQDGQVAETITVTTTCRTMEYQVQSASGGSDTDKFDACRAPDGTWELG